MVKLLNLGIFFLLCASIISCGTGKTEKKVTTETKTDPEVGSSPEVNQLINSPRHQEWITLKTGDRKLQAFVVYPETNTKTKSIIVIHENRGLDDWARAFADKLAAEGFLIIAPDFISDENKRTSDYENPDAARDAIYELDPAQVTTDLDAAFNYIKNDPSSTGEVSVIGFCWGGSQAFRYATNNSNIEAAHVFYGTAPDDEEALGRISVPVYGYYGEDDNRVNSTINTTEEIMKAADNIYEYKIYDGAGHAFMKRGIQPEASEANKKALNDAWNRLLNLLKN